MDFHVSYSSLMAYSSLTGYIRFDRTLALSKIPHL